MINVTTLDKPPIFCNRCGKPMDQYDKNEQFGFDYYVAYGSRYDLTHVKASFCCDCFDVMIERAVCEFKISPVVGEYTLGECEEWEGVDENE